MRGKALMRDISTEGFRITPAYAGKSARRSFNAACARDHPRVCGEKREYERRNLSVLGSPPRMRGKVMMRILEKLDERITPAYAGKRL